MAVEDVSVSSAGRRPSRIFGRYLVKHQFQFKFAVTIFVFLAVASAVVWLEGRWAVKSMVASGLAFNEDVVIQLNLLNNVIAKTSILSLAVVFGLSLIMSHFLAGPIYRFERTLEEMRAGNLSIVVRLRPHDEFKEVADLFNQALSSLRHRVQKERDLMNGAVEKLARVSDALKSAGRPSEAQEIDHLIADIKNTPPQIKI